MYHCELQIQIFGDPDLESALVQVAPLENFEHRLHTFSVPTQEAVASGNVLILASGATGQELRLVAGWRKEQSALVLCGTVEELEKLDMDELALVDRIWPAPLRSSVLCAEFRELQNWLKLRLDAWLTRTYLNTAIDSVPELIWFKDAKGSHMKVNNSFCRAVNKTKEQIQGRGHYYIWDIPPEEYEQGEYICLESEKETMRRRETCLFDEKVKTKNGMRQFKTYKSPIFDVDGQNVLGTVGIAHDVTDLRNMDNEVGIIFSSVPFGILICDEDWKILNANEKIGEYFRIDRKTLVGRNYQEWVDHTLTSIHTGLRPGYQETILIQHGAKKELEFLAEPITDIFHNTAGYVCLFGDVTLERRYEAEMRRNANRDFLTGLNNRRCFFETLMKKRGEQPLTLFYMDVDNFKQINDRFGHQYGDRALIAAAAAIREIFPGDLSARMGGDEFVTAVYGTVSREELKARAEALQRRAFQKVQEDFHDLKMALSIGISMTGDADVSIDQLLHQADIAMYHSKRNGKFQYSFYHPTMEREEID